MAREKTIAVRQSLRKLFPATLLRTLARDTGAVVRQRKVDVVALFWTLVLGFGVGESRSLAGLRRAYQRATGQCLEESSFYDRLNEGMVGLLKAALEHAFAAMTTVPRALRGPLAGFRDLLLTDATVIRVHELLAGDFPGCRTNHTAAAVKLHTILSVTGASRHSVRMTSERRHENRVLTIGEWICDRLLIFDLGYYDFGLFSRIGAHGGYFLSRLKDNANPLITAVHRCHRGRAVDLVGQRLQDVLPRLKRETLDVEVTVTFSRRRYAGRRRREHLSLRLVAIRDPRTADYHLYLTNIPCARLLATDIQAVYASRWQIELLFKELKGTYRIDEVPSRRRCVVETLIYAALLTWMTSRQLLTAVHAKLAVSLHARVPVRRFARVLLAVAHDILMIMCRAPRDTEMIARTVSRLLLHEAIDPNRDRPTLIAAIESRRHAYR
jgi:IS4 transposase